MKNTGKASEIPVGINVEVEISEQTARAALLAIEVYANANNKIVCGSRGNDGRLHYWFDDNHSMPAPQYSDDYADFKKRMRQSFGGAADDQT